MGKKGKNRAVESHKVIGVLADDSVIRTANIETHLSMENAVSTLARSLEKHINSTFSLKNGINIDTDTVLIPG